MKSKGRFKAECKNGCIWVFTPAGRAWQRVTRTAACECRSPRNGGDNNVTKIGAGSMNGAELIAAERARQIHALGKTVEHDDGYTAGELAWAAACYAAPSRIYRQLRESEVLISFADPFPWNEDGRDKLEGIAPGRARLETRVRLLAKAGALVAAEIDRIGRAIDAMRLSERAEEMRHEAARKASGLK